VDRTTRRLCVALLVYAIHDDGPTVGLRPSTVSPLIGKRQRDLTQLWPTPYGFVVARTLRGMPFMVEREHENMTL
jgi:hypothetical protein